MAFSSCRVVRNDHGSTIIVVVVAIIALAGLAVGMSKVSSVSTINQLEFNQANRARNLAYSGVEYVKGLAYLYQGQSKGFSDFYAKLTENEGKVDLGANVGSFIISVPSYTTTGVTTSYAVGVIGQTPDGILQAKYQIPNADSFTYTPKSTINPNVPRYLNAANKIDFSGSTYTGDSIFSQYSFNGGTNIYGSLDYVAPPFTPTPSNPTPPPLSCLKLKLTSVGLIDGTSHVCSASCLTIDGNTKIMGSVYSQQYVALNSGSVIGDVHASQYVTVDGNSSINGNIFSVGSVDVSSGTVTGDIHSGGNVTVGCGTSGSGKVIGKIYATGSIKICNGSVTGPLDSKTNKNIATEIYAKNDVTITPNNGSVNGNVNYGGSYKSSSCSNCITNGAPLFITDPAKIPSAPSSAASCDSYSLPAQKVRTVTNPDPKGSFSWWPVNTTYTISGSTDLNSAQVFPSITVNNGGFHLCLDLSVPDSYINIFVNGDFNLQGTIQLKTASGGSCNEIDTYSFNDLKKYAKRIYMEIGGSTTLTSSSHDWVGTIYSNGNISGASTLDVVGALYSNGKIDTNGGSNSTFVISDYVNANW